MMNNSSLFAADRATHLKIVGVSLLCAMLVTGVGLAARVGDDASGAAGRLETTVVKPGKALTASAPTSHTVR
jgi:hypothetical protein